LHRDGIHHDDQPASGARGASLAMRLEGKVVRTVDLPDLDGKNDSTANEYDKHISVAIPAGARRVAVENPGADWLVMDWLEIAP
jgi:hypothetical protein